MVIGKAWDVGECMRGVIMNVVLDLFNNDKCMKVSALCDSQIWSYIPYKELGQRDRADILP